MRKRLSDKMRSLSEEQRESCGLKTFPHEIDGEEFDSFDSYCDELERVRNILTPFTFILYRLAQARLTACTVKTSTSKHLPPYSS